MIIFCFDNNMSLNLESGTPVAYIVSKADDKDKTKKKNPKTVYLSSSDDHVMNSYHYIQLPKEMRFQLAVNTETERMVGYINGQSGSGKTYFARQFIENFHKMYPKRPVFIFSVLQSDKTLDSLKYIQRVNINEAFINEEWTIEDYRSSLCLYDDLDTLKDKAKKSAVMHVLSMLLELGRHQECYVLYLSHLAMKGRESQTILNECNFLTFFPNNMQAGSTKYMLERTFGLDRKQIEAIKKIGETSRSVTLLKSFPQLLISENLVCLLKDVANI